jgi:hypothetical protein
MLLLIGLTLAALAMAVAQRRARRIRSRVTRRWGDDPPSSWEEWGRRFSRSGPGHRALLGI